MTAGGEENSDRMSESRDFLNNLASELRQALPEDAARLRADLHKNLQTLAMAVSTRLNLVSREEYEVQVQLLARLRAHLEDLERQVAELERRLERTRESPPPKAG